MRLFQTQSQTFSNPAPSPGRVSKQRSSDGFTLVEVLVVIIIIGILAGLLIPAIGSAMRRSKEFAIQKDLKDLEASLESFKQDYGVYPIDFRYGFVIDAFVDRLSPRHAYGSATSTIFVAGNQLENPYFGVIAGSPQWRDPANIDAAEGYVFLLGELTNNKEYPLGYIFDGTNWIIDTNGQQNSYYSFDDEDLTDLDQDGWAEFSPKSGPKIPYCYFDSRTYTTAINNGDVLFAQIVYAIPNNEDAGLCYPYSDYFLTQKNGGTNVFEEPEKYQIISAGMDGVYGKGIAANPGYRYSKNEDAQLAVTHRDNLVSFRDGRLDNEFE